MPGERGHELRSSLGGLALQALGPPSHFIFIAKDGRSERGPPLEAKPLELSVTDSVAVAIDPTMG